MTLNRRFEVTIATAWTTGGMLQRWPAAPAHWWSDSISGGPELERKWSSAVDQCRRINACMARDLGTGSL